MYGTLTLFWTIHHSQFTWNIILLHLVMLTQFAINSLVYTSGDAVQICGKFWATQKVLCSDPPFGVYLTCISVQWYCDFYWIFGSLYLDLDFFCYLHFYTNSPSLQDRLSRRKLKPLKPAIYFRNLHIVYRRI